MTSNNNGEAARGPFIVDGVAASPFKEYPGRVAGFPSVFDGRMYRAYVKANKKQDGDPDDGIFRHYPHYRILTEAISPAIELELPDGQDIDDPDTLDTRLLWWFGQIVLEYLTPFLIPGS